MERVRRLRGEPARYFDPAGYWVSILGEDWRWRMFPAKGDYGTTPLNAAARQIADSWDPANDAASGDQCKGFSAPVVTRVPGRFISRNSRMPQGGSRSPVENKSVL